MGIINGRKKRIVPEQEIISYNKTSNEIIYIDDYGFERRINKKKFKINKLSKFNKKTELLIKKMDENNGSTKFYETINKSELKLLCIYGLPFKYRRNFWKYYSNYNQIISKYENPNQNYIKLSSKDNPLYIRTIIADINRTFPLHKFFMLNETKNKMKRILNAFSFYKPKIGYVQGINYIVSLLLFHFNEMETFYMLISIFNKLKISDIYTNNLKKCSILSTNFNNKMDIKLTYVLSKYQIPPECYCIPWYLTIMTYSTHLSIASRIWDLLLVSNFIFNNNNNNITTHDIIDFIVLKYSKIKQKKWIKNKKIIDILKQLKFFDLNEIELQNIIRDILKDNDNETLISNFKKKWFTFKR